MLLEIVLVGGGGAVGSIARFLVSNLIQRHSHSSFPWGTYAVNGTGSLLIGIVFALFDTGSHSSDVQILLVAGMLGGYTTFSTFSIENMELLQRRRYRWLVHNTAGQVAGGLLLAAAGYWLGSVIA